MNYHTEEFGEILKKMLLEITLECINTNRKAKFWFWTQNWLKCVWITWPSSQIKTLIYCKLKFLLWKKSSPLTSGTLNQNKRNVKTAYWSSMLVCTQETDLLLQEKSIRKILSRNFFSIMKLCHFRKTGKISSEQHTFQTERNFHEEDLIFDMFVGWQQMMMVVDPIATCQHQINLHQLSHGCLCIFFQFLSSGHLSK